MMKTSDGTDCNIYVADFETTVYKGQTHTEVWSAAIVKLFTEDVKIFNCIEDFLDYVCLLDKPIIYFHNLSFDGSFLLAHFLKVGYKQAFDLNLRNKPVFRKNRAMKNKTFKYLISSKGLWYSITLKLHQNIIEFRDSYKLLPFAVEELGKSFETKYRKLHNIEYTGYREAHGVITEEEKKYISNDVFVVKECMEIMYKEQHVGYTIGSACLKEIKKQFIFEWSKGGYREVFPDLSKIKLNPDEYGTDNADAYIRKSYKGGYCYVVEEKQGKILRNGFTLDINSLYPYEMSGDSGNRYPIGNPHFFKGKPVSKILNDKYYFFIRFKCRFKLKDGYLPFIQIKSSLWYRENEYLKCSDIKLHNGDYTSFNEDGTLHTVELTLTKTDYIRFLEFYNISDMEFLDGCWFYTAHAHDLFDEYIERYKKIKEESTGAKRTLAKLFLNNAYGKLATSSCSSYKVVYMEDDVIKFRTITENEREVEYIPAASAITSYSRDYTIRTAQLNYNKDGTGFAYADTDSLHCNGMRVEDINGVEIDSKRFGAFKLETKWDLAIFARQKTYIERVTHKGYEKLEKPVWNVTCAGMPDTCKNIVADKLTKGVVLKKDEFIEERNNKMKLEDFKRGFTVRGKLTHKRIEGGVVLKETTYEMR